VCDARGRVLNADIFAGGSASAYTEAGGRNEAAATASEGSGGFRSLFGMASGGGGGGGGAAGGNQQRGAPPSAAAGAGLAAGSKKLAALLDAPSHIVAAPSTLFAALMQALMQRSGGGGTGSSASGAARGGKLPSALARAPVGGETLAAPAIARAFGVRPVAAASSSSSLEDTLARDAELLSAGGAVFTTSR
jgi:hypothetical protein